MAGPRSNQPGDNNADYQDNQDGNTSNGPSPETDWPLAKTIDQPKLIQASSAQADEHEAWVNWAYPPEFYDRLSAFHLTHEALAELDRRNRLIRHHPRRHPPHETASLIRTMPKKEDLARFARHGGPDLMDVYNCYVPKLHEVNIIGRDEPSLSKATTPTTEANKKKSTPYNADFEQHLEDHDVQPTYDSQKPANLAEIRAALTQRRPSLSSSQFSDGPFDTFQDCNERAKNEDDVMADVIPAILGKGAHSTGRQELARNILFNNLAPLTDGTIAQPKPDIYYGARPTELCSLVRDALGRYITPSTGQGRPLAPNFFFEVKGPDGTGAVAFRQVRYDGAVGSRAIHSLQNFGDEEVQYDGHAYTFSSVYHASSGTLQLFAHHATAPTTKGGRPEYHMTRIKTFSVADDRATFIQGVTAFRNARDVAKQHRDRFIRAANEATNKRASRSSPVDEDMKEPQKEDGRQETATEESKQDMAFRDDPLLVLAQPVPPNAGSPAKKQMKRRYPSSEVSFRLTRARKKFRQCLS